MPIKTLTLNNAPQFPIIGKLRKGAPKTTNNRGADLKYFRFTSDRPEVVAAFEKAYGKEPVSLNIYLPFAEPERCFSTWCEEWSAGGLVHRCDGEWVVLERDATGHFWEPAPQTSHCPYYAGPGQPQAKKQRTKSAPGCGPVGYLTVVLPELWKAGYVGYVRLETHSVNDIVTLDASLKAVIAESNLANGLKGIPFVLRRTPKEIGYPKEDGGRARRTSYLLSIEPVPTFAALQLEAAQKLALTAASQTVADIDPSQRARRVVIESTGEIVDVKDPPWSGDEDEDEPEDEGEPVVESTATEVPPEDRERTGPEVAARAARDRLLALVRAYIDKHEKTWEKESPAARTTVLVNLIKPIGNGKSGPLVKYLVGDEALAKLSDLNEAFTESLIVWAGAPTAGEEAAAVLAWLAVSTPAS